MHRRTFLMTAAAVPAGLLSLRPALAAEPPVYAEGGVAIDGTDPVAYFTDGGPVAGDPAIFSDWNGARMLFSSSENKAMFDADPDAFAPQFGGYCAFAVSEGYVASTVPEAWTIHEGRLYLNYSRSVRRRWLRDIDDRIARANANWPGVLG